MWHLHCFSLCRGNMRILFELQWESPFWLFALYFGNLRITQWGFLLKLKLPRYCDCHRFEGGMFPHFLISKPKKTWAPDALKSNPIVCCIYWLILSISAIGEGDIETYKKWLYARPSNFYNMAEMLVRGPSSYTRLHFYSKFPILLTDTTGQEHFCKFRLVPAEDGPFDGLLTQEQQRETTWGLSFTAE